MGTTRSVPILKKNNLHDVNLLDGTLAISSMEGWRTTMEDSHILINMDNFIILGIFDGHGNDICAKFCRDNFQRVFTTEFSKFSNVVSSLILKTTLMETFKKIDNEFKEFALVTQKSGSNNAYESGTTALVVAITNTDYIIANVGDSRGIIIDKITQSIKFATMDHKPNLELERSRIEKSGHTVSRNRVDDSLATSRAIGDFKYKDGTKMPEEYAVTCVPDITIVQKTINTLLILACDGIWDVLTNQSVMEYVLKKKHHIFTNMIQFDRGQICTIDKYYKMLDDISLCSESDSYPIEKICEYLIDIGLDLGSKDNFTVAIFNC
jgi:serine/threonine protein phosphatase PrpC